MHIGTSGWSYDHWQGVLYPPDTPVAARLPYYLQRFRTVEVNSTYYRWPADATFARWYQRLPDDFCMTIKAPRGLTHGARLYAPERWLARMTGGLRALGRKRGILLVQLPPTLPVDAARLAYFLHCVPTWLKVAVEFRHASWHCEAVWELLAQTGAAYCVMSGAHLPCHLRATAPFVYVRLHGPDPHHLYAGSYSEDNLRWWAGRIGEWQALGKAVYVYFNNDGAGNAVRNAARLRELVGA